MPVAELLARYPDAWRAATRHPFLAAVRDGTLPAAAFATWLAQDYLFVGDLLVFQARLLARAPRPAQAVLATGLVALEAELTWFEQQAERLGLRLATARHPVTAAYHHYLQALDGAPAAVALTALWALERAYLEAWQSAAPGAPDYRAFVDHWTAPAFAEYVAGLERVADAALATGDDAGQAEAAFRRVAELERDFWQMALDGAATTGA
jgi:thiaminase/transcriptional activator TenA